MYVPDLRVFDLKDQKFEPLNYTWITILTIITGEYRQLKWTMKKRIVKLAILHYQITKPLSLT